MKKLMSLAVAVLFGTGTLFASNGIINPENPKKEIRTQIVDLLESPEFVVTNEINVELTFTFSSEGEIVVLNVNSQNRNVLNYIRENINYKKIAAPGERDKIYIMPLKVKTK